MTQKTLIKESDDSVIRSVKSGAKRDFEELVRSEDRFQFNAPDLAGSYSGNPELWCLWYSQLLSDFFTGIEELFNAPVERNEDSVEDGLESFIEGFIHLSDKASKRTDSDTTPLIKSRNKIQNFIDGDSESVTIVISITGGDCDLECIDGFVDDQIISFHSDSTNVDCVDESSLIEHSSEIAEYINGYSPYRRRPQEKYKRTLCVSVKRVDKGFEITVGADEIRTRKYSVWEKILTTLGEDFSSKNYTEFMQE